MTEKDLDIAIEKCERIMEFDTRTLENPESENGHIFEKVYDLLQFLRQLQFATDTNVGGTNDTISRQALLDAVDGVPWYHQNQHGEMVHGASEEHQAWYKADEVYKAIESVPSAQPTCTENVPVDDCISRQAAIDALNVLCQEHRYRIPGKRETYSQYNEAWQDALGRAEGAIGNLPSAQPDVPDTNVGDMISRQAAIKALEETKQSDPFNRYEYQNIGIDWSIDAIKALPSAQPGWIPTSERLPKTEEKVLITCERLDIYGKPHRYVCKAFHVDRYTMRSDVDWWDEGCDEYREEDDQYYVLEGWYEYIHNWGDYSSVRITEDKVVAWCELPTPYREGGQDGKN